MDEFPSTASRGSAAETAPSDAIRRGCRRRWLPRAGALLLALASWAGPAGAFDASDVVLDPATGLEWLKVSESVGRSYDDLVGVDGSDELAPGGDFAGFRHATVAEAGAFLANAGFDVLGTPETDLFEAALSLILRLGGPTSTSGDVETVFGITGDDSIAVGSRDRILVSLDGVAGTGQAGPNGAFAEDVASPLHGHLLVRAAAPLPERFAWVARSSEAGLAVIDAATQTVIDTVATGRPAVALAVTPDQTRLYALNLSDSSVSVVDPQTRSVVTTYGITTTGFPRDLEVSADGTLLFVTDADDPGAVLVLNAATGAVVDSVAVERFPYAIRRSPHGTNMFVSSSNTLDVSVIDVASLAVVDTSDGNFAQFASDFGAGSGLFYSVRSSTLHEVDPVSLTSQASVSVGADTRGVTASDRIGRVFTSSNDDATVSVVDLDTFSVVTTIPTGTVALFGGILASGIDVTGEGDLVFAAQGNNDTVVVLDTLSNTVVDDIEAGDTPIDVVVVPEPGATALGGAAFAGVLALAWLRRRQR